MYHTYFDFLAVDINIFVRFYLSFDFYHISYLSKISIFDIAIFAAPCEGGSGGLAEKNSKAFGVQQTINVQGPK